MYIPRLLDRPHKIMFILGLVTSIFVSLLPSLGQGGANKANTRFQDDDEITLVHILKRQELSRNPEETVTALRAMTNLLRVRHLKSPESYVELIRFLDFEFVEVGATTQTNLDTHPAMAALYYAGEEALPFLTDVIGRENEESRKSALALWTIIYIKEADFRLTYAYLDEQARHCKSSVGKQRLLMAARRAANFDPER